MLYKLDTRQVSMRCIVVRDVVSTTVNQKVSHGVGKLSLLHLSGDQLPNKLVPSPLVCMLKESFGLQF